MTVHDVFATPAACVGSSPRSADWVKRAWNNAYAGSTLGSLRCSFGLVADQSNDYSLPVWHATPKTTRRRVFYRPGWPGRFGGKIGQRIPWDSSWYPAGGKDGHAVVADDDGTEWDLWGLSSPTRQTVDRPQSGVLGNLGNWLVWPRFNAHQDIVAATVARHDADDGGPGPAFICSPLSAGVTTAAEVASGHIGHALRWAISNPLAGPPAPRQVIDPDDPDVGVRWALAGLPCGMHEGAGAKVTTADMQRAVPHGLRLAGVEVDIDRWLDRRGYVGRLRTTAAVIATAAVDYGITAVISTPGPSHIQFDSSDRGAWVDLGIGGDGNDLLAGLFEDPGQLRALAWPTGTLADGSTTKRAGAVSDVSYRP